MSDWLKPPPKWKQEHDELYDENGKPTPAYHRLIDPRELEAQRKFPVVRVSERFHDYVLALQCALQTLHAAQECDAEMIELAYRDVSLARENLYTYVENLERKDKQERTITLRF